MLRRYLLMRIQIDASSLVSVFEINWKLIKNASNTHRSWVLEPCGLLSCPIAFLSHLQIAVFLLLAWLRRLVFDRIDMEWYWEKWAIVTASGCFFSLRSQCDPFDISDCFSRAPLEEVWGINWISLNCAHGLLTVFSESMMSAMQMFHLWYWEIIDKCDEIQIGVIIARLRHIWLWSLCGWLWQAFSVPHQSAVFSSTRFLMVRYFKEENASQFSCVTAFVTKLCSMKVTSIDESKNSYVSVMSVLLGPFS